MEKKPTADMVMVMSQLVIWGGDKELRKATTLFSGTETGIEMDAM